jgi:hypothetical protein
MMTTPEHEEVTQEEILAEFKTLGVQIVRMKMKRRALYARQNELIRMGHALGLSAVQMARARQPKGEVKYVAESFRQVIRMQEGPEVG